MPPTQPIPPPEHTTQVEQTPTPILLLTSCLIRPYTPTDAPATSLAANSPLISRYMRNTFPSPYTLASAENWIRIATTPPVLNYAIMSPDNSTFYGGIGLQPRTDVESRTMEIGYWIGEDAWGRGIATEAVREFSRWAFQDIKELLRVEASVFDGNMGSCRVLEKCGYKHEGTRRRAVCKDGVVMDIRVYGLLREECLSEEGP